MTSSPCVKMRHTSEFVGLFNAFCCTFLGFDMPTVSGRMMIATTFGLLDSAIPPYHSNELAACPCTVAASIKRFLKSGVLYGPQASSATHTYAHTHTHLYSIDKNATSGRFEILMAIIKSAMIS